MERRGKIFSPSSNLWYLLFMRYYWVVLFFKLSHGFLVFHRVSINRAGVNDKKKREVLNSIKKFLIREPTIIIFYEMFGCLSHS